MLLPAARVAGLVALVLLAQGAELPRRWRARPNAALAPVDPAVAWVKTHTSSTDVIMAIGDGQRIGYEAGRSTTAVPHARFTALAWDESRIRRVVAEYRVRVLVVTRTPGDAEYTPFVVALMRGEAAAWLHQDAETATAYLYTVLPDAP